MSIADNLNNIKASLPTDITLVAVSKTKPVSDLQEAYQAGQRIFGENKIQEMAEKYEVLPKDIQWHMIGHVQRNKVKYMAPFVSLIHGVDSFKLLEEIDKQAKKNNRIIPCLLQMFIAKEDTKFGLDNQELIEILESEAFKQLRNIEIHGLMGMATFTDDQEIVRQEFTALKQTFDSIKEKYCALSSLKLTTISMGMSNDYTLAIECGSTMVRIGSSIFGHRNY
ncbi:YggS family pyridoxal phosphate-dependent enzyme [Myroides pelagicus]|uniref:Pyridoxal phosphate homeostasis protein n=1 Tax=Myroides pelagicus TaxID=270914 RepID=A0A7K1GMU2_9FLAO|nr:YggS family pyridoxal phosphate-dependent enzyme [Myroides pelagicus]MEC4113954.1 YggS family pyridoxal phosphate-dependent enzyme [Myroides pelagicus]MTH30222.1 YggS family pyridoxal phosphate-dependent enzyme [Myroides pelagicus]